MLGDVHDKISQSAVSAGWRDRDGEPTSAAAFVSSNDVVAAAIRAGHGVPHIYPTLEGGLSLEWSTGTHELGIEAAADGSLTATTVEVCDAAGERIGVAAADAVEALGVISEHL